MDPRLNSGSSRIPSAWTDDRPLELPRAALRNPLLTSMAEWTSRAVNRYFEIRLPLHRALSFQIRASTVLQNAILQMADAHDVHVQITQVQPEELPIVCINTSPYPTLVTATPEGFSLDVLTISGPRGEPYRRKNLTDAYNQIAGFLCLVNRTMLFMNWVNEEVITSS